MARLQAAPGHRSAMPAAYSPGALPDVVIIGAMKCATTSLHQYLDAHPDIAMSEPKELNFFFGPDDVPHDHYGQTAQGTWHRGVQWYAHRFSPDAVVRGESSPGYTSPDHPEVAARMAAVIPGARLIYLVRDPIHRAVSQYRHHAVERDEQRPIPEALLDPASQYISRGRYHERLLPFLTYFDLRQIAVVAQERLHREQDRVMREIFDFLRVDAAYSSSALDTRWNRSDGESPQAPASLAIASARHSPTTWRGFESSPGTSSPAGPSDAGPGRELSGRRRCRRPPMTHPAGQMAPRRVSVWSRAVRRRGMPVRGTGSG